MTMEEFHRDCIPAAYLPAEYGGNLPSCDELNQRTVEQFGELKEFFRADEELVTCYANNQKQSR